LPGRLELNANHDLMKWCPWNGWIALRVTFYPRSDHGHQPETQERLFKV
jgi:hypothetical protein